MTLAEEIQPMKSFAYGSLGALAPLTAIFVALRPTEWVACCLAAVLIAVIAGLSTLIHPTKRVYKLVLVGGGVGALLAAIIGLVALYLIRVPR